MSASLPHNFPNPTPPEAIEVKDYPEYRAVTYSHSGNVQQASQVAFNPLYQHISTNQIAMTTPVEVRYLDGLSPEVETPQTAEVSFLYPNRDIWPKTLTDEVKVTDYPPMTVVSIGIQGAYSWASYEQHLQRLQGWLKDHSEYVIIGPPRRLLYNSPMTPEASKLSEVQIPIARVNA
ncbi:heme-binding protein [Laspinema sp. A4]|uniref:heme-binding protein n=1 Tax=Laspinema sp. D2d TaxID=2953686 RepID=UPI0021BB57B6|nr:heme-binding protein [Laspinema sp. D2d]MCT7985995.1 heme-binding protein [Laspinema sp. D2d]